MTKSPKVRFAADVLTLIGAAFLVVVAMTYSAGVAGWLSFAVSIGILLVCAAAMADRSPGSRLIHGAAIVVAGWSIVAALVFSGTVLSWLVFGNALLLGALALIDLVVHEVTTERVVHELDVRATEKPEREPAYGQPRGEAPKREQPTYERSTS